MPRNYYMTIFPYEMMCVAFNTMDVTSGVGTVYSSWAPISMFKKTLKKPMGIKQRTDNTEENWKWFTKHYREN
jgi:hypothetical protein